MFADIEVSVPVTPLKANVVAVRLKTPFPQQTGVCRDQETDKTSDTFNVFFDGQLDSETESEKDPETTNVRTGRWQSNHTYSMANDDSDAFRSFLSFYF